MPTLELTDQQVVELVKQLPAEQKRTALLALANDAAARRDERMEFAQAQIRRICAERGLNWDKMSEDERDAALQQRTRRAHPTSFFPMISFMISVVPP